MPFPEGWPPRTSSGQTSMRFYQTGTTTAAFDDNAYLFIDGTGANPYTELPVVKHGDDKSRFPAVPQTVVPPNPAGTGENDLDSPKAMIWSVAILVRNTGDFAIEISFDGTNVHGYIEPQELMVYGGRRESGIALRGASASTFIVEAW